MGGHACGEGLIRADSELVVKSWACEAHAPAFFRRGLVWFSGRFGELSFMSQPSKSWMGHLVWVRLVVAFGNIPLYGWVAQGSPDLRDVPWLNLPVSWVGLGLAGLGTWCVFARGGGALKKGLAWVGVDPFGGWGVQLVRV